MGFDRLAPHYPWMERVLAGSKLQRCRTAWLSEVHNPKRILLLGEGHGRFLATVRHAFPNAEITVLDASKEMLLQARKKLGAGHEKIAWVQANIFEWAGEEEPFDLLVTNFFLDCFTRKELDVLLPQCARWLNPGGRWLIADFHQPSLGLARVRAGIILWLMYRFFRVATGLSARELTCPEKQLRAHGFVLERRREFEWGLLRSDLWLRPRPELAAHSAQSL
jgi:ubiquinone/menaquinone biosynthesis C-methylase UbiE